MLQVHQQIVFMLQTDVCTYIANIKTATINFVVVQIAFALRIATFFSALSWQTMSTRKCQFTFYFLQISH